MPIAKRPDLIFTHGNGSRLIDSEGIQYLDFIQGWAVNALGHSPEIIHRTLCAQSKKLISPSPVFYNQPMIDCANLLTQKSIFDHVFFTNSFHGRTLTTMSASGKDAFQDLFEPKTPGFIKVAFNKIDEVERAIDEQTVAIMLEPIQGEAGVIPATDDFMIELRKLADHHKLLLIFDEVQTGIARTGELFAYQAYSNSTNTKIYPDIMTLGKELGGGVPIAALLATEQVSVFDYGDQGGTYNGNPLRRS